MHLLLATSQRGTYRLPDGFTPEQEEDMLVFYNGSAQIPGKDFEVVGAPQGRAVRLLGDRQVLAYDVVSVWVPSGARVRLEVEPGVMLGLEAHGEYLKEQEEQENKEETEAGSTKAAEPAKVAQAQKGQNGR